MKKIIGFSLLAIGLLALLLVVYYGIKKDEGPDGESVFESVEVEVEYEPDETDEDYVVGANGDEDYESANEKEELVTDIEIGQSFEEKQIPDLHMKGKVMISNQSNMNNFVFQVSKNNTEWEQHKLNQNDHAFFSVSNKGEVYVKFLYRVATGHMSSTYRLKERKKYYIDWDGSSNSYTVMQYIED